MKNKEIPAIAMGTWSWGTGLNGGNTVFGNEYNEEDLRPVFKKAMEKGFILWDTAAVYGLGNCKRYYTNYRSYKRSPYRWCEYST